MKRIVLVRHAKAVAYGYDDDFNRDLRDSGEVDAQRVSDELKARGVFPDKILSSPALRALKTAQIFAGTFEFVIKNIQKMEEIYEGLTTNELIEVIHTQPKEAKTVFFFGHNPDFHYFAQNLLTKYTDEMPTCAAVVIDFDVDKWEKVVSRTGILAHRIVPKDLR
jgi:phosphohistidine phosphatase